MWNPGKQQMCDQINTRSVYFDLTSVSYNGVLDNEIILVAI